MTQRGVPVRSSLLNRITATVGIVSFAIAVLVIAGFYVAASHTIRTNLIEAADASVERIAQVLADPLYTLSDTTVENIAAAYLSTQTLDGIIVESEATGLIVSQPSDERSVVPVITRRILYDDIYLGTVTLWFSDDELDRMQSQLIVIAAGILVAVLVANAIAFRIVVYRTVGGTVRGIVDGLYALRAGNYHHRINETGYGDVDPLIRTINEMAGRVGEKNEYLEQRVAQRTEQLEASLRELRAAQEQLVAAETMVALRTFVEGISHEMNTPLGAAVTSASHLKSIVGGDATTSDRSSREDMDAALTVITESLSQAITLVKELKKVAVEPTDETPHAFDLADAVREAVGAAEERLDGSAISIDVSTESVPVTNHASAVWTIVSNLVLNAAQHAFPDRRGTVRFTLRTTDDGALLQYDDDGVGLDPRVRKRVFEPFYTTKPRRGNTGLGLYVVYRLVFDRLNGSIEIASKPNEGVHITIEIPNLTK